jgi:hypothetical protein
MLALRDGIDSNGDGASPFTFGTRGCDKGATERGVGAILFASGILSFSKCADLVALGTHRLAIGILSAT